DDLVHHEVGLARGRRSDVHRLVGELDMARVLVGIGVDGHRLDAHLPGGLDDAAGDFAAVGNEDLVEHVLVPRADQRGMLPCLRHGLSIFLSRSITSERQMRLRVSCGWITSSMKPRAPATKGLANCALYSASRAAS